MSNVLTWRELLALGPTLLANHLDEPVLAIVNDEYGDATAYPLTLDHNLRREGERALFTEKHEEEGYFVADVGSNRSEGGHQLRLVPAGQPLLVFDLTDDVGKARDEELRRPPVFVAGPAPTLPSTQLGLILD